MYLIKAHSVESELLPLSEAEKINFPKVPIYDRTICDVLKNMNKVDTNHFKGM